MVWNLIGKTATTGLGFALMVLIARWLPPAEFGAYSLVMAIFSTLLIATSLGLDTGLMKYLPEFRARKEAASVNEVFTAALIGKFLLLLLATAILLLSSNFFLSKVFGGAHLQRIYLCLIPLALIPCGLNVLFRSALDSDFKQGLLNVVDMVSIASRLLLTVYLLLGGHAITGVLVSNVVVEWLVLFFLAMATRSRLRAARPTAAPHVKKLAAFSLTVWVTVIATFLIGKSSDLLLLGMFGDSQTVGWYNLAYTFSNQAYMFMTLPLGNLTLVAASELHGTRDARQLTRMSDLLLKYHLLFVPPLCAGGVVLAEPIIRCLYGDQYLGATLLLQLYMSVFAINILFSGSFFTLLASMEEHRMLMISSLVLGVLNLLLNLFLVPRFGALGALSGTGFVQVLAVVWLGCLLRRKIPWEFPARFAWKTCSAAAAMALGLAMLRPYATNLAMLSLVIALGGLLYALVLKASRPFSEPELALLRNSRVPGNKFFLRLLNPA